MRTNASDAHTNVKSTGILKNALNRDKTKEHIRDTDLDTVKMATDHSLDDI